MFSRSRIRSLVLILISLMFILAGCASSSSNETKGTSGTSGSSENSKEKILKVSMTAAPGNLDPHFATTHAELEVLQPIYNGLLRYKPGTSSVESIEGDLAKEWNVSDDGMTWTFQLHEGVQWHKDYGELTSEDVKYSLERVMNPDNGSPRGATFKFVDRVEAPDKYTVIIHMEKPNPSFILGLVAEDQSGAAIVKKEAIEGGKDDAEKMIGTGPFVLESYTPGEKVVYVKNKEYFRGEPKLDGIEAYIMRDLAAREVAMDKGDIHFTYGEPDGLWVEKRKQNKDLVIETSGLPMAWTVHLNTTIKPLDNILVRKAIAHAIDYSKVVEMLGDIASPMNSPLSGNVYGHADVGQYEYNPKKAKEFLAEAGYPDGLTLPEAYSPNIPAYTPVNSYIQEQLRQVGIDLPIQTLDTPAWSTKLYNGESSVTLTITLQRPHAALNLYRYFHSKGGGNFTKYAKSDALIEQAELEVDETKAMDLFKQIQQAVHNEYVNLPILETVQVQAYRKNVDLGYELKDSPIYVAPIYETTDLK